MSSTSHGVHPMQTQRQACTIVSVDEQRVDRIELVFKAAVAKGSDPQFTSLYKSWTRRYFFFFSMPYMTWKKQIWWRSAPGRNLRLVSSGSSSGWPFSGVSVMSVRLRGFELKSETQKSCASRHGCSSCMTLCRTSHPRVS